MRFASRPFRAFSTGAGSGKASGLPGRWPAPSSACLVAWNSERAYAAFSIEIIGRGVFLSVDPGPTSIGRVVRRWTYRNRLRESRFAQNTESRGWWVDFGPMLTERTKLEQSLFRFSRVSYFPCRSGKHVGRPRFAFSQKRLDAPASQTGRNFFHGGLGRAKNRARNRNAIEIFFRQSR